ncbi:MAG: CvpA family protein, partial [Chloroflexi bacterium]|nr:CvpA family protein [Chloroflexota bacterium]
MNWFDGVIIVLILLLGFAGFRMGLIRAFFLVAGLLVAAILAAQISGPIASALTDGLHSASTASIVAYGIVFSVV